MKYYLIIVLTVLAFACSNNKVPKGILTEKEITPVLVEIHLAEAIFSQRYALEVTRENYQEDLYLSILKKYKLDRKVFEASVLYYGKNPIQYKPIYDEVLNRLNEMIAKSRASDSILTIRKNTKAVDSLQIIHEKVKVNDSIQGAKNNGKTKDTIQIRDENTKTKEKPTNQNFK